MTKSWRDPHRLMPLLLAVSAVLFAAVAAGVIWSPGTPDADLVSLSAMRGAYDKVVPGRTSERELTQLGFDTSRYSAHALSQLGVQEFFMPANSAAFDRMDAAVKACFDASDRCRALVFPLSPGPSGLIDAHAAPAGGMIFLLRHGRVAYKAIRGG